MKDTTVQIEVHEKGMKREEGLPFHSNFPSFKPLHCSLSLQSTSPPIGSTNPSIGKRTKSITFIMIASLSLAFTSLILLSSDWTASASSVEVRGYQTSKWILEEHLGKWVHRSNFRYPSPYREWRNYVCWAYLLRQKLVQPLSLLQGSSLTRNQRWNSGRLQSWSSLLDAPSWIQVSVCRGRLCSRFLQRSDEYTISHFLSSSLLQISNPGRNWSHRKPQL